MTLKEEMRRVYYLKHKEEHSTMCILVSMTSETLAVLHDKFLKMCIVFHWPVPNNIIRGLVSSNACLANVLVMG